MSNNLKHTNGTTNPVFNMDRRATLDSSNNPVDTYGVPVMISGPKLDFFKMDLGGNPASKQTVDSAVDAVLKCITQLATVHFYQVQSSSSTNLSIAVYPVDAWSAADLESAIQALGTVDSYDLSSATVANNGFVLA